MENIITAAIVALLAWQTTAGKWSALGVLDPNIPGAPDWWRRRQPIFIEMTFFAGVGLASACLLVFKPGPGMVHLLALAIGGQAAQWIAHQRAYAEYRQHFQRALAAAEFALPESRRPYRELARRNPHVARGDLRAFAESQAQLSSSDVRRMHRQVLKTGERFQS